MSNYGTLSNKIALILRKIPKCIGSLSGLQFFNHQKPLGWSRRISYCAMQRFSWGVSRAPQDTPGQPPGCGFWMFLGLKSSKLLGMTGSFFSASNYRWIPKKEWWCSTDELTHQGLQQFTNPMGLPSEPMGLPSSDVWCRHIWGMNPSSLAPVASNRSKPTVGLLSPICF